MRPNPRVPERSTLHALPTPPPWWSSIVQQKFLMVNFYCGCQIFFWYSPFPSQMHLCAFCTMNVKLTNLTIQTLLESTIGVRTGMFVGLSRVRCALDGGRGVHLLSI